MKKESKPKPVKVKKELKEKVKSEKSTPIKKQKGKQEDGNEEEQQEEEYKWWLEEEKEGGVKWDTLQHAGPLFPPDYVPHNVKMNYDGTWLRSFLSEWNDIGRAVTLTPAAEEVATFFAALIETDYAKNKTFCKNFFSDFLNVIKEEDKVSLDEKEAWNLIHFQDMSNQRIWKMWF